MCASRSGRRTGSSSRRALYLGHAARSIYEVFPLVCPLCGAETRIIAFITDGPAVRDILGHAGEPAAPNASGVRTIYPRVERTLQARARGA